MQANTMQYLFPEAMRPMRPGVLLPLILAIVPLAASQPAPTDDFAFVQISDVHISPHLERMGGQGAVRGAESIKWICRHAVGPQHLAPADLKLSAPSFGFATGDLTEYGVIDDTWDVYLRAFDELPYPVYHLPGNHDNTWVAMYHVMRDLYGGENYSFDKHGCHFVCINSASPQEPVPTIDGKTRAWLRQDLGSIPPGTPVFIALHHPLYSGEFAPAEYETLIDLLRDYNVVAMLYGHGHGVSHRDIDGIDGVMGGSTYGKNAGYAVFDVQDARLRVAYHYFKKPGKDNGAGEPGWRIVLDKPIRRELPKRLFALDVDQINWDVRHVAVRLNERPPLVVRVTPAVGIGVSDLAELTFEIDGQQVASTRSDSDDKLTHRFDTRDLTPGRHLLTARLKTTDGASDLRTAFFEVPFTLTDSRVGAMVSRQDFPAAIKAGPVVADDQVFVAGTDGVVRALDTTLTQTLWQFETGGEILGTPAWSDELLVFGSGDGKIYAVDSSGKEVWQHEVGLPVYGWPLITGGTVYIGDNGGRMHALDLQTGAPRWTFARADYAIESQPCLWGGQLVFGAWDGYLYALDTASGKLAWKTWGPKSSAGVAARYYAPADCGPIAIDDHLFVCDRGYVLGQYARGGEPGSRIDEKIAGIARAGDGRSFYGRALDDRVCKFGPDGKKIWETKAEAGRFPIPPTCHAGTVYVCSNGGLLQALDAKDGAIQWSYRCTPGFYVMAPVAVDDVGACYVAGMDGSLTRLQVVRSPVTLK